MIVSRWQNQGKKKDSPRAVVATLAAASAYTTSEIAGRSGRSISALPPKKMPETQPLFRSDFRIWTKTMHLG